MSDWFDFLSVCRVSNRPQIIKLDTIRKVIYMTEEHQRIQHGALRHSTGADSECSPSTTTYICLSWRKELSHLCKLPLIPYASNDSRTSRPLTNSAGVSPHPKYCQFVSGGWIISLYMCSIYFFSNFSFSLCMGKG